MDISLDIWFSGMKLYIVGHKILPEWSMPKNFNYSFSFNVVKETENVFGTFETYILDFINQKLGPK